MMMLEHDAKELLASHGLPVPRGFLVSAESPDSRFEPGFDASFVVKAQVPVGGRGKAGGVRLVEDSTALAEAIGAMAGLAEDARRGVRRAKFAPLGARSVCGGYPFFDYRSVPLAEAVPAINEATLVVCMIETEEGLENVEEIAAVPGVDVVHVGTNDLLVAMGKPGKFDDPDIIAAQERIIAACRSNSIYAGCGGNRDVARQVAAIGKGAQYLTTQTDTAFLTASAANWAGGVRDGVAAGR